MPLQATSGAASYDAFGGGVPVVPAYIEEVFSCFLYIGNGTSNTITNNIDLSGKGGLVWIKDRIQAYDSHLIDTARGGNFYLVPSSTAASGNQSGAPTSFSSTGFTEQDGTVLDDKYVSWTFRKQPKFFDVVTYTGTGSNTTIAHNLGSVPGCIIVKRTDTGAAWAVYHRSLANTQYLVLNTTAAAATGATWWNSTTPTSTVFSVGTDASVNASGGTYIAYIFAHDAGGFGLTGTDNVISCGSYTGNGSATGPVITLGYEPQWLMIKRAAGSGTGSWQIIDNMRGMPVSSNDLALRANLSNVEASVTFVDPTSTGFQITSLDSAVNTNTNTYIYIAIRRGPMKVPTVGTSVFAPIARAGTSAATSIGGGSFTTDLIIAKSRGTAGTPVIWANRLVGTLYLDSTSTNAQSSSVGTFPTDATWDIQQGIKIGSGPDINDSADTFINYFLGRAPSVMDVVCYTDDGTGSLVVNHNLQAVPELAILKKRNGTGSWDVAVTNTLQFNLESDAAAGVGASFPALTSTTFTAPGYAASSQMVVYLFATCAGVSKIFSYTGNGSSQTINCGFTGGARFILIKRRNAVGDWYVWDTARGIIAGSDPHLSLNSTAAEVTTDDSIDTDSTGFIVNQLSATNINVSSSTYIGIAIA